MIDHSGAEVLSLEESAKLLQVQIEGRKVSGACLSFTCKQNVLFKYIDINIFEHFSVELNYNFVCIFVRPQSFLSQTLLIKSNFDSDQSK